MSNWSVYLASLGPSVWYRLGESAGPTAVDASGNGNNGTYTGSPTLGVAGLITGDADKAATFGNGNYVDGPIVAMSTTAISLGAWGQNTGVVTDGVFMGRWKATQGAMLYRDTIKVYLYINGFNTCNINNPSSARHFYVGTWDGANTRLYLDGVLVAGPLAYAGPLIQPATGEVQVATFNQGIGSLSGTIDEPFMVNRALTATEVANLYTVGTGGSLAVADTGGRGGRVRVAQKSDDAEALALLRANLPPHWTIE